MIYNERFNILDTKFTEVNVAELTYIPEYNKLPDDIKTTKTRYLDEFYYYLKDTIIGRSLMHYGEYTQLEIELLRNFLNKEMIVYDVGANIGYHTLAFAKHAHHVYAFEPNKKNLRLLKLNSRDIDNITIYDFACSDVNGTSHIQDFELDEFGNYGEMCLSDNGQLCETKRIDDIDDIYGPDLVKIDVENFEYQVLLGMVDTITEFNPIIFYENNNNPHSAEIFDMLTKLDYTIYWYPCMNYNPGNYYNNTVNIFGNGGVCNCLAMPKKFSKISNLEPMISNDDTLPKAIERIMEKRNVRV